MNKEFRYFYVEKKTRCKVYVHATSLAIECDGGECFRFYADSEGAVNVRCNDQLIVRPKASNKIEIAGGSE